MLKKERSRQKQSEYIRISEAQLPFTYYLFGVCMCAGIHLREDIRGQFVEVGALLSPCGFQRSHLGHGTWQQSLSILQSRHGWPSERDTFLRGKKNVFQKGNYLD